MGVISLPQSMEQDRLNQIKANSVHVDENFNTLLTAVNRKLEIDGSIVPTADLPMGSHKITGLATPTLSGDATNKGYVDSALLLKANLASPTFIGTVSAPTVSDPADSSTKVATTEFVASVIDAMWPVGSIYIGTSVSCPLAVFGGTWEEVATKLTIDVSASSAIKGSIGSGAGGTYFVATTSSFTQYTRPDIGAYGVSVSNNQTIPGASVDITSSALTVNVWKRTA
jgi:hypothetical protein